MHILEYWDELGRNPEKVGKFFHPDAHINWHNTNERFTVDEFIQVNCEYPGNWGSEIQRVEESDDLIITVVHIWSLDADLSFHVTSFFRMRDGLITALDEYWGDDGPAPQWRLEKHIGTPIA